MLDNIIKSKFPQLLRKLKLLSTSSLSWTDASETSYLVSEVNGHLDLRSTIFREKTSSSVILLTHTPVLKLLNVNLSSTLFLCTGKSPRVQDG